MDIKLWQKVRKNGSLLMLVEKSPESMTSFKMLALYMLYPYPNCYEAKLLRLVSVVLQYLCTILVFASYGILSMLDLVTLPNTTTVGLCLQAC